MRKWITIFLCICLLIPLAGCAEGEMQNPGNFYYRRTETAYNNSSDDVIAPEKRELAGMEDNLEALLNAYFTGPESRGLESPFPRDTALHSWKLSGDTLYLTMSAEFSALSGIDLSVACACIGRTFLELTDVRQIRIIAAEGSLDGQTAVTLSKERLSLFDDSLEQLRTELTLYYADQQYRYLIGQSTSVNLAAQDDVVTHLIQTLMEAPEGSGLHSALPVGTKLLGAHVENGLCSLDFSAEFEANRYDRCAAQRLTLLSIVNTLCQLDEVEQVEFYVEGNLLVRYGLLSIPSSLTLEEEAIGPVRTGVNEFDATLYLANGSDRHLATVPTRIRQTAGISQPELVIRALLSYTARNGFSSPIPEDTRLNSIVIDNGVCLIDLSGNFLSAEHLELAVHSIVASVCALENVSGARITVDGQVPSGEEESLFQVLIPEPNWFL